MPTPLDYDFFAHALNREELPSTALYLDKHSTVISTGASVEIGDIIGEESEGETNLTLSATHMELVEKMMWHMALNTSHQCDHIEVYRTSQRKEENFGRKQNHKLRKAGLGKVRKEVNQCTTYPVVAGPSGGAIAVEVTMTD